MFLRLQLGWRAGRRSCLLFFPPRAWSHLVSALKHWQIFGKMNRHLPGGPCSLAFFTARQNEKKKKRHNESRGNHAGLICSHVPFVVIVNAQRSHFKVSFVLLICVLVTGWFNETRKEHAFTFLSFRATVLFIFCAHTKTIQIHWTWGIVQAEQINKRVDFF